MKTKEKITVRSLEDKGLDFDKINHEMNKVYYLVNIVDAAHRGLELLLQGEYSHSLKYEVNMAVNWTTKVLNRTDKLYSRNIDRFEHCTDFINTITDLCLEIDSPEGEMQAISTLKMIAGQEKLRRRNLSKTNN